MPPCRRCLWTASGGFFYWELEKNGVSTAMKESDLNHDLVSLFKGTGHFSYKIPDPVQAQVLTASKRPFDGFARFSDPVNDFYFESKLMKYKISAFSLDRVEDHQYASLLQINQSGGLTAVILGVWIPRQEYWFMCFDPGFLLGLTRQGKKSIYKKELNYYRENNYSISLKRNDLIKFSPQMMRDRIINFLPDWRAGIGEIQR
jgi:hypothetical protein